MSVIRRNLVANALSSAYMPLLALMCLPYYMQSMGMEAFGLVGFFTALYALLSPIVMGLSMTLNRRLAMLSVRPNGAREMRDLLRTLEIIYWLIAIGLGIVIMLTAPVIATHCVRAQELPVPTVSRAILLMGAALMLQLPYTLYAGGLNGLERQALLCVINAVLFTVRFAGAVVALRFIAPTVDVFFLWNVGASALHTVVLGVVLWLALPATGVRPAFRTQLLRGVRRFAGGATAISIAALILCQLDKVILSKILMLDQFGYYAMASMAATVVYCVISPVFTALSPRLTQLATSNDPEARPALRRLYHLGSQLQSALLLTAAAVAVVFSRELLWAWTGDPVKVDQANLLFLLLIVAFTLNCLANLPYALQLAHGWTSLALYVNLGGIALAVPLMTVLAIRYGAVGVAAAWVAVAAVTSAVSINVAHVRLLKGENRRWHLEDVALPLAATAAVTLLGRWLMPEGLSRPTLLLYVMLVAVAALLGASLATPQPREHIVAWLRRRRAAAAEQANDAPPTPSPRDPPP